MDWPTDLLPYHAEFYLQTNTRSHRSPVTRTRQVLVGQGPMWVQTASFRFGDRRKEQRFEALLDKMKGQAVTVNVWDFGHREGRPLGPALDASSVSGITYFDSPGGPTGFSSPGPIITGFFGGAGGIGVRGNYDIGDETVIARGFTQNATPLFAGDQVQIGRFLYRLVEDATSNGVGWATLTLNRPLVEAADDGDVIVLTKPRTPMQLIDDDQSRRSIGVGAVREYTISMVEVLI